MTIARCLQAALPGPVLYVATTGSDLSGSGSPQAPFATIAKASTVAVAGTTVLVLPGTYDSVYMTASTGGGTADLPVTYRSTTPGGAIIESSSTDYGWYIGDEDTHHPDHVRIEDFTVTAPDSKIGIMVDAADVWVTGCHVHAVNNGSDSDGGGIVLSGYWDGSYQGTGNRVARCHVHNIGRPTNSLCHPIYGACPESLIENNLVYDTGAWGIHLYHGPNGTKAVNNTVFNCGLGGIVFGNGPEVATTSGWVHNNLVRDCLIGIAEVGSPGDAVEYRNNSVYDNGTDLSLDSTDVSGTVTSDPLHVNYQADGSGDYRLSSSSPCKTAGLATYAPRVDYLGYRRSSTTPSIGAFSEA